MSDHSILLPPVTKHRWKLTVKLMCHRQLCTHLHCHRQRHLLMRVQTHLSERKSPIGYKRFINRLVIVSGETAETAEAHIPWVLKMATEHRCSACEESRSPALRNITSSYENVPGAIPEIDGMHWQHPVTGRHARCQFMVDVGSRAPMITVFEETRERCTRNNQTSECKESLLKDWFCSSWKTSSHSNGSRRLLHEQ